ncbi:hypothetical protein FB645_006230 [Coemansia sp. IMI 203386]|nr:hypothetical protein FB645_006230 [Coemansia sp. IMI 203386]
MAKVQLVGAEISTFTRTIRMALEYLQIPYELLHAAPHSTLANKYNPFGKIPTMIHDGQVINETLAIRQYIDGTFKTPDKLPALSPENDFQKIMSMVTWISVSSDYVFRDLNLSMCKKRYALEAEGKSEEEIQEIMKEPIEHAREVLSKLEIMFKRTSGCNGDGFVVGNTLTWADLFLFPIFADICALPERKLVEQESPLVFAWFKRMEGLAISRKTFPGTVASARL